MVEESRRSHFTNRLPRPQSGFRDFRGSIMGTITQVYTQLPRRCTPRNRSGVGGTAIAKQYSQMRFATKSVSADCVAICKSDNIQIVYPLSLSAREVRRSRTVFVCIARSTAYGTPISSTSLRPRVIAV